MTSPRRSRRAVALVATVVSVAVAPLLSSCTTTVESAGTPDGAAARMAGEEGADGVAGLGVGDDSSRPVDVPRRLVMIGDSITVSSEAALRERLDAAGFEVLAVDAQVGRRMNVGERDRLRAGAWVIPELIDTHDPDLWIVALGTNDVGQYGDADAVADQVREFLARIPADAHVVWVDTWFRDRPEQTAMVNAAIREVLATRDGASVVAWSDHAPDDGVLTGDGVHLTDSVGTSRFATVVTDGVLSHVGLPPLDDASADAGSSDAGPIDDVSTGE